MVVVEMDMHTGHDVAWKVVLDMGQFPGQVPHMVVVYKGDRRDRLLIIVPLLPDQVIPDQIPQRFRAVRVLTFFDV
jgi:hypothetical protein